MQINHISNGDIHPTTLLFDTEYNRYKIFDKELLLGRAFGLKCVIEFNKKRYLSPELIDIYLRNNNGHFQNQNL